MGMIYAADKAGKYLGEFEELPKGAIKVESPPVLDGDTWDGSRWVRETKFYVDNSGKYLGGFDGQPPKGAKEVSTAPQHSSQIWDGEQWGSIPQEVVNRINSAARLVAYAAEAEPLRLAAVYSDSPEDLSAWQAKREEINARYPIK